MGKKLKIVLSIPRAGTHFIWSRCVSRGDYQLIYDADRIPALSVLARDCPEKLEVLSQPAPNPNYNFQYNSMGEVKYPATAREHLGFLFKKYGASADQDLFYKSLALQDAGEKTLLSINRFIYTLSYRFIFKNFGWTIEHAMASLRLLNQWLKEGGYECQYSMVVRQNPQWMYSRLSLMGTRQRDHIIDTLSETAQTLDLCYELNIPIFWMEDVIEQINQGYLDYEQRLPPLSREDLRDHWYQTGRYFDILKNIKKQHPAWLRWDGFVDYLKEKDPVNRTSLVRSIGTLPLVFSKYFPFALGKQIRQDMDAALINNAKIFSEHPTH